jgi:hypothetical protein
MPPLRSAPSQRPSADMAGTRTRKAPHRHTVLWAQYDFRAPISQLWVDTVPCLHSEDNPQHVRFDKAIRSDALTSMTVSSSNLAKPCARAPWSVPNGPIS